MTIHFISLSTFIAASLSLTACGPEKEPPPSSGQLSILTYNVAGLPQGISGSDPETNIIQISPHLNPYDIVLLQEDFVYHDDLVTHVNHPFQTQSATPQERLMHDGLNRLSRFEFTNFERIRWVSCYGGINSGASDCLAEKGFSVAHTTLAKGVTVTIYNLHAEAGGGPQDIQARKEGFDQLIAHINTHAQNDAIIVGGDFNLHGFSQTDEPIFQKLLSETGLRDSCRFLQCGEEIIDRILFRSSGAIDLKPTRWQIATHFVTGDGSPLSDHRAIHVDLEWSRL